MQVPEFVWVQQWGTSWNYHVGSRAKEEARNATGRSLRIFTNPWGFLCYDEAEEISATWADVTDLRQKHLKMTGSGNQGIRYSYTLELADGRSKTFQEFLPTKMNEQSIATVLAVQPGVTTPVTIEQLGRVLNAAMVNQHLPMVTARLNAGETVAFGPVTLSTRGIGQGSILVPWDNVESVANSQPGKVLVKTKKRGKLGMNIALVVSLNKILNYAVFTAVVQSILAQHATG